MSGNYNYGKKKKNPIGFTLLPVFTLSQFYYSQICHVEFAILKHGCILFAWHYHTVTR